MTILNTSFCENVECCFEDETKIKELCNHNSWKEGGGKGGNKSWIEDTAPLGTLPG